MIHAVRRHPLTVGAAFLCLFGLAACGNSKEEASDVKGAAETPYSSETTTADVNTARPTGQDMPAMNAGGGVDAAPAVVIPPETIILKVNGKDVTQADFEDALQTVVGGQLPPSQKTQIMKQIRPRIVEQLVEKILLEEAAEKAGTMPTEEQVKGRWVEIERRLPPGATIEQMLARQGLDRTAADLQIRQHMAVQSLFEKVGGDKEISDEEARAHYDANLLSFQIQEQVSARHILLMTNNSSAEEKAAKKKQIEEIRAELVKTKGANFEELALKHSECPSKDEGGSLGEFGRGRMVPEFDEMSFKLPVGEISPIVETQFGYHVIQVQDKQEAGTQPYDKVAGKIKQRLQGQARQKIIDDYIKSLRAVADVKEFAPDGSELPPAGDTNALQAGTPKK